MGEPHHYFAVKFDTPQGVFFRGAPIAGPGELAHRGQTRPAPIACAGETTVKANATSGQTLMGVRRILLGG
jgi:hypothetical protein